MTSESMKKVNKFKRDLLREQLALCTDAQQEMVSRMYVSAGIILDSKIPRAFEQIEETIKRNNAKSKGVDDLVGTTSTCKDCRILENEKYYNMLGDAIPRVFVNDQQEYEIPLDD